ncbi:bifunctional metallophosphatase/5'-nucleotidase [bacterium]|nr:bifunctional metallophosphatase/5'-nucleotidase [bacterium]
MKTGHVTLLFTSDEHGYLQPAARLQREVKEARQANPNGTLLLSSGDVFEGSAETGVLGLNGSRDLMARAGYGAMTLGNHDFDRGTAVVKEWVRKAPCKVLVSNVVDTEKNAPLENTRPSHLFELNGVKVGLVGVTTPETMVINPKEQMAGLNITDPVASVQRELAQLKAQGAQVVGVISHLGLPADRRLAESVPGLDFILGGHTHDALEQPEQVGKTLIAHPGCFRNSMGRFDFSVEPGNEGIRNFQYHLIKANDQAPGVGGVTRYLKRTAHEVNVAMNEPVGNLSHEYRTDPNTLGDDMESLLSHASVEASGVDVVMMNQKTIRAGLPSGQVTKRDVFNAFPFDNRLVTVNMKASEVAEIYKESLRRLDQSSLTACGRFVLAGDRENQQTTLVENVPRAEFEADRSRFGPLMGHLETYTDTVACAVDPDRELKVGTSDYLVGGGLGYFKAGMANIVRDLGTLREVVQGYIQHATAL